MWLVDAAHICVILACGIWTANLIVQEQAKRPGTLIASVMQTHAGVTLRLDDPLTAAR